MAALWDWEKQKMHLNELAKYADILTGKATSADGSSVGGALTGKYETSKTTLRITRGILGLYLERKGADAVADDGIKTVATVMRDVGNAINGDLGGTLGKQQKNAVAGLINAANAVIGVSDKATNKGKQTAQ